METTSNFYHIKLKLFSALIVEGVGRAQWAGGEKIADFQSHLKFTIKNSLCTSVIAKVWASSIHIIDYI